MTPEVIKGFEGLAKILIVLGAFLSALAGIYLGTDAVEKGTSERFRTAWLWIPVVAIFPIAWLLTLLRDRPTALYSPYIWGLVAAGVVVAVACAARFFVFQPRASAKSKKDKSIKVGWILLVIGFDVLLIGAIVDAIVFFVKE